MEGDSTTPILKSPQSGVIWPPVNGWPSAVIRDPERNYITAACRNVTGPCGSSPSASRDGHRGVGCGIYAYKTVEDLAWDWPLAGLTRFSPMNLLSPPWAQVVWGRVLLWGRVFEHDRGYRAEFARIDSLVAVPTLGFISDEKLADVARFYGVPFEPLTDVSKADLEAAALDRENEIVERINAAYANLGTAMDNLIEAMTRGMTQMVKATVEAIERFNAAYSKDKDEEDEDG